MVLHRCQKILVLCPLFLFQQNENEDDGEKFRCAVDTHRFLHVGSSQFASVITDIGFIEQFPEIVVRTSKATIEDAGQGSLRIAAVGRGMTAAVLANEIEN